MSKVNKSIIIWGLVGTLCIVGIFIFQSCGKKPYYYLRTDNLNYIELSDESSSHRKVKINKQEDMDKVIDAMKTVRTYNNIVSSEVPSERYVIDLVYNDGRIRPIEFAVGNHVEIETVIDKKVERSSKLKPCITINKRWYRMGTAESAALYDVMAQFQHGGDETVSF